MRVSYPASPGGGGRKRRILAIATAAAAAVLVTGGVAAAVTMYAKGPGRPALAAASSRASAASSYQAAADAAQQAPGRPSAGRTVHPTVSPAVTATHSARPATAQGLSVTAAVSPGSQTLASCFDHGATLTFSGTISDDKAGVVSYYWKLPNGSKPAQTLTFTQAGTRDVALVTGYDEGWGRASGSGTIVITSPVRLSSNPATFAVTCPTSNPNRSGLQLDASAGNHPAVMGEPYQYSLSVAGGKAPYAWGTMTGLPPGLTATPDGSFLNISGTPTAAGQFDATESVKDSSTPPLTAASSDIQFFVSGPSGPAPASATATASPAVPATTPAHAAGGPLALTNNAPVRARVGEAYSGTVTVSGGKAPYTWDPVNGLPIGVLWSVSGATLTLSGTIDEGGGFPLMLEVRDSSTPQKVATERLTINIAALPAMTLSGSIVSDATAGVPFDVTVGQVAITSISVLGGNATFVWGPITGLPPGLRANENNTTGTVLIGGTPTTAGTFTFTVTVSDTENPPQVISKTCSITVAG